MGILDRFKSLVTGAGGTPDPKGPLALLAGDVLEYYSERLVVTGVRILQGDGSVVYHYCLTGPNGERVVLLAEDGPEPVFSIQRVVEAELDWNAEVIDHIDEEPFRLAQRGRMKVRAYGDTGTPNARTLDYREFEDDSGERVIVLEDYGVARQVRVGEPVFEGELHFASGHDRTGSRPWTEPEAPEPSETPADASDVQKGSPLAAALALEGREAGPDEAAAPVPDVDPTAFDDDEWADAHDPAKKPARMRSAPTRDGAESQDSWLAAVNFVAGSGVDITDEPDDWLE